MTLRESQFARRDAGAIECRSEPMRLSWTFADLASADAHALDARVSCSARIADTAADRKMFVEVFLTGSDTATAQAITEHFSRTIRSTLAGSLAARPANELVGGSHRQELVDALDKSLRPIAFACGLELLPPFQIDIESPSLQRQRLEEIARAQAQQRTAGQLQQMQRATDLLKQFQQMRQAAPNMSAGKLLEQMNAADRGLALQTLLLASSSEATHTKLWSVAGQTLVQIDPRVVPPRMELIELPTALGPLRSVQPATIDGQQMLLIGAQRGVIVLPPGSPSDATCYASPNLESQLGFNRVVSSGHHIWASHSEAGIVAWELNNTKAACAVYAEISPQAGPLHRNATPSIIPTGSSTRLAAPLAGRSSGPRNLQLLDESHLIYSVANQLIVRNDDSREAIDPVCDAEVIAIVPTARWMLAIHADGTIVQIDRLTRQVIDTRRRGASRLTAACAIPWLADIRLLLASDDGPIDCIGLDDPLVSQYLSPYRGLKILTAVADVIAAVSPDRQRVIFWHSWDGQRPIGEVHVTGRTKHRVADLEWSESAKPET